MSFISKYLAATEGNESPLAYHLWACMSTLSVAAGRRFWFKLGRITYYPNLYVLLVGEPGVKKSTAMDIAKDLIRDSGIAPIAASQVTKEFIGKKMSMDKFEGKRFFNLGGEEVEYNQYAIFATEFTQFLAVNPEGMLEFFTAVYGEKIHAVDTKNSGSDYVLHPYITLLGCLTPHMLNGFLKTNILTGGFARRTVFVYGTAERIIPIPEAPPEDIVQFLRTWIQNIQSKSGEFTFGPGAKDWYIAWYTNLQTKLKDISKRSTEAYYRTKQELLFKVAMLIVLSEGNGEDREILPAHFELAERTFFSCVEKNLERVFEGAGQNPNSGVATQVCRMLEALDRPMKFKEVQAMFGEDATSYRELEDTLTHLCVVDRLRKRTVVFNGTPIIAIGTPSSIDRYSDADLLKALGLKTAPAPVTSTDSSPLTSPTPPPLGMPAVSFSISLRGIDEQRPDTEGVDSRLTEND